MSQPQQVASPSSIQQTQQTLSKIIQKPPLTDKLLGRPPFRYLHDIFSEIINTTGFAEGLFDTVEMNSENVKDKDAKLNYLQKIISVVSFATNTDITASPLKIIAGLDPDATNEFLQILGKAVLKRVDARDAVKRVLNGERYSASRRNSSSLSSSKSKSKSSSSLRAGSAREPREPAREATPANPNVNTAASSTTNTAPQEPQIPPPQQQQQRPTTEESREDRSQAAQQQQQPERDSAQGLASDRERNSSSEKENDKENVDDNVGRNDSTPSILPRKFVRPTTARPAPPKQKTHSAVTESLPVTLPTSEPTKDDDEFEVKLHDGAVEDTNEDDQDGEEDDGVHGGLVKGMMKTKEDLEGPSSPKKTPGSAGKEDAVLTGKEKVNARKETENLRTTIQSLVKSTTPLAKTLDYFQEDIDAMAKELELLKLENDQWKGKVSDELRNTLDSLVPLEKKLKDVETAIEEQLEKISNTKATIIANDQLIAKLLQNIAQPVR